MGGEKQNSEGVSDMREGVYAEESYADLLFARMSSSGKEKTVREIRAEGKRGKGNGETIGQYESNSGDGKG